MRKLVNITAVSLLTLLLAGTTIVGVGAARAADLYLCAGETTLTMPDGTIVPVWGFAQEDAASFAALVAGPAVACTGPLSVPGPELRISDDVLNIHLFNTLLEPVSIQLPGQAPAAADVQPVWINTLGSVTGSGSATRPGGDVTSRVRSFVKEVAPGTSETYSWPNLNRGTFLYQSATHPAVQVQMGLYGALINDVAAGQAYDNIGQDGRDVSYAVDQVLLFSEIDASLHDAVADGAYGPGKALTSTIDYEPDYYLINGKPYSPANGPINAAAITPIAAGNTVLLRFLNAGLDSVAPTLAGVDSMLLQAEDSFGYPYARSEYSVDLPAGKSVDATFVAPAGGYVGIYDRRMNLAWKGGGINSGGQLTHLVIGTPSQTLTVNKDAAAPGQGTVLVDSLPGGLECAPADTGCTASYLDGTRLHLKAIAAPGSGFAGWSGDCAGYDECVVTMDQARTVTASFKTFTAGTVKLLSSNKLGTVMAGTVVPLNVGAPANAASFEYQYSVNNGKSWQRITRQIPDNAYNWLIPDLAKKTTEALVKVSAYKQNGALIGTDVLNNPFTIKVVELTAPLSGDTLTSGGSTVINWNSYTTKAVANVVVQYRKTAGKPWENIDTLPGNPGTYTWSPIPAVTNPKTDAQIRVLLKDANGKNIDTAKVGGLIYNPLPPP